MKSKVSLWFFSIDTIELATKPYLQNPIYQTKSAKPNLYLEDKTKSIEPNFVKPNLQIRIYKIQSTAAKMFEM